MIATPKIVNIGTSTICYASFKSIADSEAFANEQLSTQIIPSNARTREGFREWVNDNLGDTRWFGKRVSNLDELENDTRYQDVPLLDTINREVRGGLSRFDRVNQSKDIQARHLQFNSMGLGNFSFDKAAGGLYKDKKGGYGTTINDPFIYYAPKNFAKKAVRIYVSLSQAYEVNASELLYNGIAPAILSDYLNKKNIATEINLLMGGFNTLVNKNMVSVITVKSFTERTSLSSLAYYLSDPRYFRYKGLYQTLAISNLFNEYLNSGFGHPLNQNLLKSFVNVLGEQDRRSKNIYFLPAMNMTEVQSSIQEAFIDSTTTQK